MLVKARTAAGLETCFVLSVTSRHLCHYSYLSHLLHIYLTSGSSQNSDALRVYKRQGWGGGEVNIHRADIPTPAGMGGGILCPFLGSSVTRFFGGGLPQLLALLLEQVHFVVDKKQPTGSLEWFWSGFVALGLLTVFPPLLFVLFCFLLLFIHQRKSHES